QFGQLSNRLLNGRLLTRSSEERGCHGRPAFGLRTALVLVAFSVCSSEKQAYPNLARTMVWSPRGTVVRHSPSSGALLLALRGFALASGTFRLNLAMGFLDVVPPLRRCAGRFRLRRRGFDQGDRLRCIAQSGR